MLSPGWKLEVWQQFLFMLQCQTFSKRYYIVQQLCLGIYQRNDGISLELMDNAKAAENLLFKYHNNLSQVEDVDKLYE